MKRITFVGRLSQETDIKETTEKNYMWRSVSVVKRILSEKSQGYPMTPEELWTVLGQPLQCSYVLLVP